MYLVFFLEEGLKNKTLLIKKYFVIWDGSGNPIGVNPKKGYISIGGKDLISIWDYEDKVEIWRSQELSNEEIWPAIRQIAYEDGNADFEMLEEEIQKNKNEGYESAIISNKKNKAIKYGSLVQEENELPDEPQYCKLIIWNNYNIETILEDFNVLDQTL